MESDDMAIEIRDRQYAAKLVDVTAAHIDPPPKRDRLGIDAWAPPAPEQCDECDVAGAGLVKARGLWSARVYGRDRQIWGDVAEGMRVAYYEVVQPSLHA